MDVTATWPALDALETALAVATPGPWKVASGERTRKVIDARGLHVCETFLAADAAAIVAAVNLAPKLIAAVRAIEDLAAEFGERGPESNGWLLVAADLIRTSLTAALGDPQPDTRQCPATRDDGYRCQAFTAHDKHVDSLGRMW